MHACKHKLFIGVAEYYATSVAAEDFAEGRHYGVMGPAHLPTTHEGYLRSRLAGAVSKDNRVRSLTNFIFDQRDAVRVSSMSAYIWEHALFIVNAERDLNDSPGDDAASICLVPLASPVVSRKVVCAPEAPPPGSAFTGSYGCSGRLGTVDLTLDAGRTREGLVAFCLPLSALITAVRFRDRAYTRLGCGSGASRRGRGCITQFHFFHLFHDSDYPLRMIRSPGYSVDKALEVQTRQGSTDAVRTQHGLYLRPRAFVGTRHKTMVSSLGTFHAAFTGHSFCLQLSHDLTSCMIELARLYISHGHRVHHDVSIRVLLPALRLVFRCDRGPCLNTLFALQSCRSSWLSFIDCPSPGCSSSIAH
ncbi:hypothetical protein MRB53_041632 [Persea americana]|nr:hypothetical protein MRB53_041632 [Persea americana]